MIGLVSQVKTSRTVFIVIKRPVKVGVENPPFPKRRLGRSIYPDILKPWRVPLTGHRCNTGHDVLRMEIQIR